MCFQNISVVGSPVCEKNRSKLTCNLMEIELNRHLTVNFKLDSDTLNEMTFSYLSGNLWIPSQKNCADLAAKNESSQFLIPCSDVNRIPVRAFCIDRNKW